MSESAAPYLEPGETIRAICSGREGPSSDPTTATFSAFGPRIVAATDRNVYVLEGSMWSWKASGVLAKYPLGSVSASYEGGLTLLSWTPKGTLTIGDHSITVPTAARKSAARIAAMARGQAVGEFP